LAETGFLKSLSNRAFFTLLAMLLVPLVCVAVFAVLISGLWGITGGMVFAFGVALIYYVHHRTRRRGWQRGVGWIIFFSCGCAAMYSGAQLNYSLVALFLAIVFVILAGLEVGLLCSRFLKPKLE
jgi:hypothetical protein